MNKFNRTLLVAALSLVSLGARAAGLGNEAAFNIVAQDLPTAIIEFSDQAGVQVVTADEKLTGLNTQGVSGRLKAEEALRTLLRGTGLGFKKVGEETVALVKEEKPAISASDMSSATRVAQGDTAASSAPEKNTQGPPEQSDSKLEEIVVTAQKRQERLQDVPISIAVLTGEALDKSTAPDVTEMLGRVPGVSLQQTFAGGTTVVTMRGVGSVAPLFHGASTVAYYLDSVPFGFSKAALVPDAGAYDMERVEVLRGPQGTLFGASALNGVVRVLTKDADLDDFEFKARGSSSSTQDGGWNYRGDAAINAPLIEGKLAARAVVGYQDWSGWIDRPHKNDANDEQQSNVRLKINAQPTEELSIGLSAWRSRNDSNAPATGEEPTRTATAFDEPAFSDYDAYGLKIGYQFGAFALASTTSYVDYAHSNSGDLSPIALPGIADIYTFSAQTFAEELILTSTHAGAWRWSLGGMYRDSKDRIREELPGFGLPAPSQEKNASESYAVFGELTRLFMDDKLELTAGVRYFEDEVKQTEESRFDGTAPEQLIGGGATFNKTTKRLVLTWHPSEQTTFYTSYGEGFRSGANQEVALKLVDEAFPPTQPDSLKNYEVGARASFLGGRLSLDSALYYIDWQDAQRSRFVPVLGICCRAALVNVESASGAGVDLGVTATPIDRLHLGANVGWNDLHFDSDVVIANVVFAEKGDRLDRSPEWTAAVSADYGFLLGGGGYEGRFEVSANYTSQTLSRTFAGPLFTDSMLIARTGISILAPQHWTATLFVDNVTNEDGVLSVVTQPEWWMRVRPRTAGVQVEYRW